MVLRICTNLQQSWKELYNGAGATRITVPRKSHWIWKIGISISSIWGLSFELTTTPICCNLLKMSFMSLENFRLSWHPLWVVSPGVMISTDKSRFVSGLKCNLIKYSKNPVKRNCLDTIFSIPTSSKIWPNRNRTWHSELLHELQKTKLPPSWHGAWASGRVMGWTTEKSHNHGQGQLLLSFQTWFVPCLPTNQWHGEED